MVAAPALHVLPGWGHGCSGRCRHELKSGFRGTDPDDLLCSPKTGLGYDQDTLPRIKSNMSEPGNRLKTTLLGLIAICLWAVSGLFFWVALGNTWYGWVSQDWPVARGTVVRSAVEEVAYSRSDNTQSGNQSWIRDVQYIRYRPVVVYHWQVDGQLFERDRRNFAAAFTHEETREAAEAILAPYPRGATVDVYYDPDKPSRGILEPGAHWDGFSVALIIALVVSTFALVYPVVNPVTFSESESA